MAESKESLKDHQKRPLGRGLSSLFGEDVVNDFRDEKPVTTQTKVVTTQSSQPVQTVTTQTKVVTTQSSQPVQAVTTQPSVPDNQRIWQVDIEKIGANPFQPRRLFDTEKLKELSESIREKGILQPIIARRITNDSFEIIAGERRWRAAQLAGVAKVPVILKEVANQESLELALIENIQRHDLNPIEEAEAYRRLADEFSLSQQEVSQKVGKDRATVANSLRLLGLPKDVKDMLSRGEISTGHAKVLLALNDPAKQSELAKKINSEKLTVRAAEKLVQAVTRRQSAAGEHLNIDVSASLVKGLQDDLTKILGTKVDIAYQGGKGNINIRFYTDEDLTRIIERIKK